MASSVIAQRVSSFPTFLKVLVPLAGVGVVRSWAGGYVCREDRLLHDKTFILVGGFSGPGLELFRSLALRGCQVIALHPTPADPRILQLTMLLRATSGNERLYCEECDVRSVASVRAFVKRWDRDARKGMVGDLKQRIEALVFCDGEGSGLEDVGLGLPQRLVPSPDDAPLDLHHASLLLSRHALIQLLLPTLLQSSQEAPVRIILALSPFYAASPPLLPTALNLDFQKPGSYPPYAPWVAEGQASLASLALLREFQDRLDTTRAAATNESTNDGSAGIVCLAVCGGFTRAWFRKTLRAGWSHPHFSWIGWIVHLVLLPLVWLLAKSAEQASQDLLLAVLGSGMRAELPTVVGEEAVKEKREEAEEKKSEGGGKIRKDEGKPKVRLRAGCLYRDGQEVSVPQLEVAGPTLGPALWAIESKRVEKLVALAEAVETAAAAQLAPAAADKAASKPKPEKAD
ncbi:hypothetical protein RQP46_008597 [Phenoliferia psychrophenolica]